MNKKMDNFKSNLSDALELPKDIVMDLPKITIIGDTEISILNHKGIVEYTDEVIRVNSNSGIIKIEGNKMAIKTILTEEIIIFGQIDGVTFLK